MNKKRTTILITILVCLSLIIVPYGLNASKKSNNINTELNSHYLIGESISQNKKTELDAIEFKNYDSYFGDCDENIDSTALDPVLYLHPALGDNSNNILAKMYEYYDGVSPLSYIFIHGSNDDGESWTGCCWLDLYGASYPSIDYFGSGSQFYGTFVPPHNFLNGAALMLADLPDPMNPATWDVGYGSLAHLGFYDMVMAEIASDNSQEYWNWGFESVILSRNYPGEVYQDVPVLMFPIDFTGDLSGYYYSFVENCQTTSADIDHVTARTYAAFDQYDIVNNQYRMFICQDRFGNWGIGTTSLTKWFIDTSQHIRYPVVSAYNDNLLVITATYNDANPNDKDIICWYTNDGNLANLDNISLIAATNESENYPELSHVNGDTYVCTYVMNNDLYATYTGNAGVNWSLPVKVNDEDEIVVEEYRTADIGDTGKKVIYEYQLLGDNNIYLSMKHLDTLDPDGDGVYFYDDNCPFVPNPLQTNSDSDNLGDACDNCPFVTNPDQEDYDGDEIGDDCDTCPQDPLNDIDGDSLCGGEDNCPEDYNPGQDDNDSDFIGDACDNCPYLYNPGQEDADKDDIGDDCDTCTDTDGDGYGNPGYPMNTCPDDNCPNAYNPDQLDSNFDGVGDVCSGCGDANGDGQVDIDDVVSLITYIFSGGPPPNPVCIGDADGSTGVDIDDVVYLINYIFSGGPPPVDPCCL